MLLLYKQPKENFEEEKEKEEINKINGMTYFPIATEFSVAMAQLQIAEIVTNLSDSLADCEKMISSSIINFHKR